MKSYIFITLLIFLINSCFLSVEESYELLDTFRPTKVDSVFISIGKTFVIKNKIETEYQEIIDSTFEVSTFKKSLNKEIENLFISLSINTFKEETEKVNYRSDYFNQVDLWQSSYNVKYTTNNSLVDTSNDYILNFDLYFYTHDMDYDRLEILMNQNGLSYTFCCKDNSKFPYNTFKGLSKFNRGWVFEDSVKVQIIKMVNRILKEVDSNNTELKFISK